METVLVTGAGGYIGSNAAEYFVNAGYRVIGTVRNRIAERLTRLGIKTISIDLSDATNLPRLFEALTLVEMKSKETAFVAGFPTIHV